MIIVYEYRFAEYVYGVEAELLLDGARAHRTAAFGTGVTEIAFHRFLPRGVDGIHQRRCGMYAVTMSTTASFVRWRKMCGADVAVGVKWKASRTVVDVPNVVVAGDATEDESARQAPRRSGSHRSARPILPAECRPQGRIPPRSFLKPLRFQGDGLVPPGRYAGKGSRRS